MNQSDLESFFIKVRDHALRRDEGDEPLGGFPAAQHENGGLHFAGEASALVTLPSKAGKLSGLRI